MHSVRRYRRRYCTVNQIFTVNNTPSSIFLYGQVDLPPIPEELLIDTHGLPLEKYVVDIGYEKMFEKNNTLKKNCAYAKWTVNHQPLIDWITATVPAWPSSETLTIQKNIANGTDSDTLFPAHHDVRRMFALNYVIATGGDSVITSWFKDVNQPLVRSLNKKIGMQTDTGPVEYKDLRLLDSVQCHPGKWYLIRTNVLHDVDHVDNTRSAVTIPYFEETIVDELKSRKLFKTIKEINTTALHK